jgi:hypothetical protein
VNQERIQPQQSPQPQRQPDIAEVAQPLEPNALQFDQHRFVIGRLVVVRRIKQRRPRPRAAVQAPTELHTAVVLALLEFSELGDTVVS